LTLPYHKRRTYGFIGRGIDTFMPRNSSPQSQFLSPNSMLANVVRARTPVLIRPLFSQARRSIPLGARLISVTSQIMSSVPIPNDFVRINYD